MERRAWEWLSLAIPLQRSLLAQNQSWRGGELDLVFEERGDRGITLVFCEVRCRNHARIQPLDTLTRSKREKLRRSAARFLARYAGQARSVRFDLLGWTPGDGWRHWPNMMTDSD